MCWIHLYLPLCHSMQLHTQWCHLVPWNTPWGSTYTEIGKHCKSGLFIHLLIYLHIRYIYIWAFELGYQHTTEPHSYIWAVPVEQKLLSEKGECKKWEPSLALTVPRIPRASRGGSMLAQILTGVNIWGIKESYSRPPRTDPSAHLPDICHLFALLNTLRSYTLPWYAEV